MIAEAIESEIRALRKNNSMCWIHYKKSYDIVPNNWILESLDMVEISENVRNVLRGYAADWRTVTAENEELGEVAINQEIYKGDFIYPFI